MILYCKLFKFFSRSYKLRKKNHGFTNVYNWQIGYTKGYSFTYKTELQIVLQCYRYYIGDNETIRLDKV